MKHSTIILKMNFKKYIKISERKLIILDQKAIIIETKKLSEWSEKQIKDWVGLWFHSSLYHSEQLKSNGFKGWLNNWTAKLNDVCGCKEINVNELLKFGKLLDNLKNEPDNNKENKCKQFIIKMVELLGFKSLLCIGI